jgi:hypothetical protein
MKHTCIVHKYHYISCPPWKIIIKETEEISKVVSSKSERRKIEKNILIQVKDGVITTFC